MEIKTEVKSEIQPPRLSTRAPVAPEGGAAAPAAKRQRSGGASPTPLGGAFCQRSRPWITLPPVAVDRLLDVDPPGPRPREAAWVAQLARLAAYKAKHGDCSVPKRYEDPRLGRWVNANSGWASGSSTVASPARG